EIADAPRGPVRLDTYGNPIQNVYFRKVERNREGELQNTVIVTIPAVSQFWKYSPDAFLRQPVYSRDVPPCRYCCARAQPGRPPASGTASGMLTSRAASA